jgi:integrase
VAKARDMFIFACYTGLAYSDLIKVSRDDIFREGNDLCIVDKRQKTGTQYNIILLPKALEILERYNYNINLMTNQKCNDNLKLIAHMANIPINLTMHVGRHTFATWALSRGVSIETVSKMLAHSDVGTTERYAKVLPAALVSGYHKLR